MPDREFIHSSADVALVLLYAIDSGMEVMVNEPYPEPVPHMLGRADAAVSMRGNFYLFRPEWVYGPFQPMLITEGYNRGKYFVQRANFAPIAVYFQGERLDGGVRRFGSCSVSSYRDWLELPRKVVNNAPSDTDVWFKNIVSQMMSGVTVKAGVHKYHISKGVMNDPDAATSLPPFDFIPWKPKTGQNNLFS